MTTFNLKLFISKSKEENDDIIEDSQLKKKKITSLETTQMMSIRGFLKEISNLSEKYKVSSYEINLYITILKTIKDFEEGNMKLYVYCFMISRNYNFVYEELKKDIYGMVEELTYIYQFFSPDMKEDMFRDFCRDIYVNCLIICRARNLIENKIIDETNEIENINNY